jgi:hypothetical protein
VVLNINVAYQLRASPVLRWNMTSKKFEEQLSGLVASEFRAIGLRNLLEAVRCSESIPHRTFAVR